jgi:uncharacterized protein with HEPN domain
LPRNPSVYLEDILEAIRRIASYADGMGREDFARSPITIDAVVRNLEVIGEASARIPEKTRAAAPEVEWRKIIALRNILAHEYFGINANIIWDVVVGKLKPLERECRLLLAKSED